MAAVLTPLLLCVTLLTAATRIPIEWSEGRVVLPVTVGDSRPLRVLLDSGMGFDGLLIYDPAVAESLALPGAARAQIGGAGSGPGQPARVADSASFRVGPLTLHGQRIIVLESDTFRGFSNDGVTGFSILGHHAVTIDRARGELVLRPSGTEPPDDSWTALPLEVRESGIPWVRLTASVSGADSLTLDCYLDLASRESIELLTGERQRFVTPDSLEDVLLGRGLSGDVHGARGRVAWLRLGSHRWTDAPAAFTPARVRSRQAGADAVLGSGLLRRFDCILDYGARRLYLRPRPSDAEARAAPRSRGRAGR